MKVATVMAVIDPQEKDFVQPDPQNAVPHVDLDFVLSEALAKLYSGAIDQSQLNAKLWWEVIDRLSRNFWNRPSRGGATVPARRDRFQKMLDRLASGSVSEIDVLWSLRKWPLSQIGPRMISYLADSLQTADVVRAELIVDAVNSWGGAQSDSYEPAARFPHRSRSEIFEKLAPGLRKALLIRDGTLFNSTLRLLFRFGRKYVVDPKTIETLRIVFSRADSKKLMERIPPHLAFLIPIVVDSMNRPSGEGRAADGENGLGNPATQRVGTRDQICTEVLAK